MNSSSFPFSSSSLDKGGDDSFSLFPSFEKRSIPIIQGLKWTPSLVSPVGSGEEQEEVNPNDQDFIHGILDPRFPNPGDGTPKSLGEKCVGGKIQPDFSLRNREVLAGVLKKKRREGTLRNILEIGVNREGRNSSTRCILQVKGHDTKYLGIDIAWHVLNPIRCESRNIFCYKCDSGEYQEIVAYAKSIGIDTGFDVIFIDGFHSVNQVLKDWKFTQLLNPRDGCVIMHDTNYHPGPYLVWEAIDETLYDKVKYFTDQEYDWGIGVAYLKRK